MGSGNLTLSPWRHEPKGHVVNGAREGPAERGDTGDGHLSGTLRESRQRLGMLTSVWDIDHLNVGTFSWWYSPPPPPPHGFLVGGH